MTKKYANGRDRDARSNHENRANQLNPNNDAYWKSRGHDKRPREKNNASSTKKNEN